MLFLNISSVESVIVTAPSPGCCVFVQVVSALLECNAKLNKKDHYGNTPLIHACLKGHVEIATVLLEV